MMWFKIYNLFKFCYCTPPASNAWAPQPAQDLAPVPDVLRAWSNLNTYWFTRGIQKTNSIPKTFATWKRSRCHSGLRRRGASRSRTWWGLGRRIHRHDTSPFPRLVLGCINTDLGNQIVILQHFSRSTRFAHFCTARNSNFWRKIIQNFQKFYKYI